MDKATELLKKLDRTINTAQLDMGGNHKYSLTLKSHAVISGIKGYLYDISQQSIGDDHD